MKNKGITLIALVVTIIILLILAGITINITLGENGMFNTTKTAKESYKIAEIKEKVEAEILLLDIEKISKGETLTKEQALIEINKKGIFQEINLEESTGIIQNYIVILGYNENGKVIINGIENDTETRIITKIAPSGYTKEDVQIQIGVRPNGIKILSIEAVGMMQKENGTYEVTQNGTYIVKVTLENGEILEQEIKIDQIDKLPPKEFTISTEIIEKVLNINANVQDEESSNTNACSGIEKYEYYLINANNETIKYDTNIIDNLNNGKYKVYSIAYDKAGNSRKSNVEEIIIEEEWEYNTETTQGKVTLTKYIGSKKEVVVPTTYKVNGIEMETELGKTTYNANKTLCKGPFIWNQNITKVILPDTITKIDDYLFYACTNLADIYIPNNVEVIGKYAFYNNSFENITLPNNLKTIDSNAFECCYSLKSITIPNSVTVIGKSAFVNCNKLDNVVLPNKLESINEQVFGFCYNLKNINIPNSVLEIGDDAFWACKSITRIVLPNNLQTIGQEAFGACESLYKVWIPKTVTKIKTGAFSRGTDNAKIYCEGSEAAKGWYYGWNGNSIVTYNISRWYFNSHL